MIYLCGEEEFNRWMPRGKQHFSETFLNKIPHPHRPGGLCMSMYPVGAIGSISTVDTVLQMPSAVCHQLSSNHRA